MRLRPIAFGTGICGPAQPALDLLGKIIGLGYDFLMAEIVNLNRFRKSKSRAEKRREGDENAAKFGRSKVVKILENTRLDKEKRDLDGHELE